MKSSRLILLFLCVGLVILHSACRNKQPKVEIPDLTILKADTAYSFKSGDRFIFLESFNSCCMYCYGKDSILSEEMFGSPLFKFVETIEDPSDPDCAGCSNYYYNVMECTGRGTDTIYHYIIAMGDVGEATSCEELGQEFLSADGRARKYIITVHE